MQKSRKRGRANYIFQSKATAVSGTVSPCDWLVFQASGEFSVSARARKKTKQRWGEPKRSARASRQRDSLLPCLCAPGRAEWLGREAAQTLSTPCPFGPGSLTQTE